MDVSDINSFFSTFLTDLSTVLSTNVPLILGILAALLGLGWVVRKVRRYITGKKF